MTGAPLGRLFNEVRDTEHGGVLKGSSRELHTHGHSALLEADAWNSTAMLPRLAAAAVQPLPLPYRLLKQAEAAGS